MPKTGTDHLNSLRDGRTVYLDGQRIADVVAHPAYRNAVHSIAHLYDFQSVPEHLERLTFLSPTTGNRVNRCWQLPYSYADLVQRREALTAWAETTYGFMGRSPDHVASCLSGMVRGLTILSRKSYEGTATSEFDNPLSSHVDENDAMLYFDEVKVPWERVFVYRDTDMCRAQFHDTPAHIYQNYQAQIRLMVKTRFLLGLARKIVEANGILNVPQVRDTLAQLAAQASMVEGMVQGMEAAGASFGPYY